MTELNSTTEMDPGGEEAQVSWPALSASPVHAAGHVPAADAADTAVAALLDRLSGLPELPVDQHQEVYAGLHDDLLAALNEAVAGGSVAGPAATDRPPGGHDSAAKTTTKRGDATHEQA